MDGWNWINKQLLIILNNENLTMHGGVSGIRDDGLLDSALNGAPNLALYSKPDIAELAAAYGFGLAKNDAFIDGNKHIAFLSIGLFLGINGYKLKVSQVDATLKMLAVAGGEIDEADFVQWIRSNVILR